MTVAVLTDGFSTIFTLQQPASNAIKLVERTVKPVGMTGGGPINRTGMRNTAVRTKSPKTLYEVPDITTTCEYDPAVIDQLQDVLQVNQKITITYPDGSTVEFWGWLESFDPSEHQEGTQPTATVTFIVSNLNASGVETPPVYAAAV